MSLLVDLTDTSRMITTSSEDSDSEYDAPPHAPYTRSPLDAARGGLVRKPARRVRKDVAAAPRIIRKKKHTTTASRR